MTNISRYVGKYMIEWIVVAILVGIGGGLSAVALKMSIDFVGRISGHVHIGLAPLIGGILVAFLYLLFIIINCSKHSYSIINLFI